MKMELDSGKSSNLSPEYCSVGLLSGDLGTYFYRIPEKRKGLPESGSLRGLRVRVPFRTTYTTGIVVEHDVKPPEGLQIRAIYEGLDPFTVGDESWLQFLEWASRYYLVPVGAMLHAALPPILKKKEITEIHLSSAAEDSDFGAAFRKHFGGRSATWGTLESSLGISRARAKSLINGGTLILGSRPPKLSKPKTETLYRYEKDVQVRASAHVEAALLAFLRDKGSVRRKEILSRWPNGSNPLRRLVDKGAFRQEEVVLGAERGSEITSERGEVELTEEQALALSSVEKAKAGQAVLLHGVTGSGKTEIYLRLAEKTLAEGKSALLLVPEIGLTPGLLGQVRARFGEEAAVLHSGLSPVARLHEWWRIRHGLAHLVVGVRSAVFAPLSNLGLIVVDEEHDDAYKQGSGLRYHARDLALARGALCKATVVLGSATPSSESTNRVALGKNQLLQLRQRATEGTLPEVGIIDLRTADLFRSDTNSNEEDKEEPETTAPLTSQLVDALRSNLSRGEQSILLLNRRGFAPWILCITCGEALTCSNCAVSLTWHQRSRRALCHTCGFQLPFPDRCTTCGTAESLTLKGHGTERITETLQEILPGARITRFDRDTAQGTRSVEILRNMTERKVDILVGTQMVAKGHDFPNVTLVGVLMADQGLRMPDFRGSERTFQLLTQVAGRAGRGSRPGKVYIQTYIPQHPAIRFAINHDTEGFIESELAFRERAGYPPYRHLALLEVRGPSPYQVDQQARKLLDATIRLSPNTVEILGPAPAAIPVVRGKSRVHLVLKCATREPLRKSLRSLMSHKLIGRHSGTETLMDIDPIHFL